MFRHALLLFLAISAAQLTAAQSLPSRILGYRVHKEPIVIDVGPGTAESGSGVTVEKAVISDVSPFGITILLDLSVVTDRAGGRIDFMRFHNVRINGLPVDVSEYSHPFMFKKGSAFDLPEPVSIFVSSPRIAQAAYAELRQPGAQWTVTGRVLLFGKFRRYGMTFKRVIPVDLRIRIKDPLGRGPRQASGIDAGPAAQPPR